MHAFSRARHATFPACLLQRGEEALDKIVGQKRRIAGDRDDMTDVCTALGRPGERGMQPRERTGMAFDPVGDNRQPKLAKRAGSTLALIASAATCGSSRAMTWARTGLPASGAKHLSPPPMRLDLPPASTTPATKLGGSIAGP